MSVHQAVCHGLGLTNILIEALEVGNAVLKSCASDGLDQEAAVKPKLSVLMSSAEDHDEGDSALMQAFRPLMLKILHKLARRTLFDAFGKWSTSFNPRRSNKERINELIENVFHCLSALIDTNSMAKHAVLESIDKVVGVVEVGHATSPRNLVTLCGRLFKDEPSLCSAANRDLLRLLCDYTHRATQCLFTNDFSGARSDDKYDEATSTREITDGFLVSTLNLMSTICGSHENGSFRANQLFVAATLIPDNASDPIISRFRDFTACPDRASASVSTEESRVALVKLLNAVCINGGDARRVRMVLPMSWFIEEITLLQDEGDDSKSGSDTTAKRKLMEQLLFSVYFNDAGGSNEFGDTLATRNDYELVTFAEKLRPLCHQPEGPETKRDLERLRSTMLVLYAFSNAVSCCPVHYPLSPFERFPSY